MKTHNLKLSIEFCDAVLSGEKTFEVRKNDRGFQTGDLIRFIPTDGTSYRSSDGTVREHAKHEISGHTYKITYILNGWGIKNGYVVLGIRMKRSELEKYLGQKVEIKLSDGDILKGVLHKTGEEQFKDNLNLYLPQKRYFMTDDVGSCVSCMFRSSHVVLIREISDVRLEV